MSQMAPNLDDLRFQKNLVDEARRRIIRYCPEWTDYNLSDPGITLIELFAYMAEALVYRLNRVPEKNYLKFLEMMGLRPEPASSAKVELSFYLSVPFPVTPGDDLQATVPQGLEVTTRPSEEEEEITFTVDERMALLAPRLVQFRRDQVFNQNFLDQMRLEAVPAFNPTRPQAGDTFYIGFDESQDIRGYILRLTFDCEESHAVGVRRDDPPWVWECSSGNNRWQPLSLSQRKGEKDTTGGLNNPHGALVIHLPLSIRPDVFQGRSAYWLRCRLQPRDINEQGMYDESPRIQKIEAHCLGGKTLATHATILRGELVGTSNGEPGQTFRLQHSPVLALRTGETIEIEEGAGSEMVFRPWECVRDFSNSDRFDRHYTLDEASGEVSFGPAVRQADGTIRQYGRIPEAGRRIRASQYRFGGGGAGNVPAEKIQVLRSAVPYIDQVVNFARAEGGRDQENLEEVKMRAQRELRAQQRAVTAEDFESLALSTSQAVARVKCSGAGRSGQGLAPGVIELLVVPAAFESVKHGDYSKLILEQSLRDQIRAHLDEYRLIATILNLREPAYWGVKVCAEIVAAPFQDQETVRARVSQRLNQYLCPLKIGTTESGDELFGSHWEGWPFGRDLFIAELYSLVQQVPGVKHVMDVTLSYRPLLLGEPARVGTEKGPGDSGELRPVTQRMLAVPADTLLCSLDHEITLVEL